MAELSNQPLDRTAGFVGAGIGDAIQRGVLVFRLRVPGSGFISRDGKVRASQVKTIW